MVGQGRVRKVAGGRVEDPGPGRRRPCRSRRCIVKTVPAGIGFRARAECEAESVAYVVAGDLGLDSSEYSFGYIAGWAGGGDNARAAIAASGNAITMAAKKILDALNQEVAA